MSATNDVVRHIADLKQHLGSENTALAGMVESYEDMDGVLRRLRLIRDDETLTGSISWWPVVSVLGMFSAGKSTSINELLGVQVQRTGRQAVDDVFTVICHGPDRADLPGTALARDSRFPFYGMEDEIERADPGKGRMIDSFLALKTVPSQNLKGLVVVDSPGFDSDEVRTARLRLVDHVVDLSDLVLVYFDANRPEPGAMRDTLTKLVARVGERADPGKFLYVLNQIDTAARENNLEDVVGAWQRALASAGLVPSRFYTVYNEQARVTIGDPVVAERLRSIRDRDMAEIRARIAGLQERRGYRVAAAIGAVAKDITEVAVPKLEEALGRWKRRTNTWTQAILGGALALLIGGFALLGDVSIPFALAMSSPEIAIVALLAVVVGVYLRVSATVARREGSALPEEVGEFRLRIRDAFRSATRLPPLLRRSPVGWGASTKTKIEAIRDRVADRIRGINDAHTDPSAKAAQVAAQGSPVEEHVA